MPAESAIEIQTTAIRELYKSEYASRKNEDLVMFAQKLHGLCGSLTNPTEQVAMLRETMSVAGKAGDIETGIACLAYLLNKFATNQHDERQRFWSGVEIQNQEDARTAVGCLLEATTCAIQDDRYPSAVVFVTQADQLVRRYRLSDEQNRTKEAVKQAKYLGTEFAKLSTGDLLGVLTPDEHTAMGRFLCLAKDDWEKGLSHLLEGSDAELKSLAEADSAVGESEEKAEAAAEAWLEWARKQPIKFRSLVTGHAIVLLRQAANSAMGLAKIRIEKRLKSLGDTGPTVSTTNLRLWFRADMGVIKNNEGKVTKWQDQSGQGLHALQDQATCLPIATRLNGISMVQFDGKDDCLSFNCDINGLAGMTIAVVSGCTQAVDIGRHANECAAIWWGQTGNWGNTLVTAQAGKIAFRFGTGQSDNFCIFTRPQAQPLGALTLSLAIHDGAQLADHLYVNGVKVFSKTGQLQKTANNTSIGYLGRGEYDTYLSGFVAEVLVYNAALDEQQRVNLESYLRKKYLRGY